MSQGKKWLIAAALLFALLFGCGFGLSFISDIFLVVALFSGISAMLCLIVGLSLTEGKRPPWAFIGLLMTIIGAVLLPTENFFGLGTFLSALYAISGAYILLKEIVSTIFKAREKRKKLQINMKLIIAIGLFLLAGPVTMVLFYVEPMLIFLGILVYIASIVLMIVAEAEKNSGHKPAAPLRRKAEKDAKYCELCGRILTYPSALLLQQINDAKYCANCSATIQNNKKQLHMVCSGCGVDLPAENMHMLDNALFCHDCFLKKCSEIETYRAEPSAQKYG